jgi:hypothetical protein
MTRIVFTGSRNWDDSKLIYPLFDALDHDAVEIIHGGAQGLDSQVDNIARLYGHEPTVVHPDWDQYGKAAGPIRNSRMAQVADLVIAYRSFGRSRGTDNMIANAILNDVPVLVCANYALRWQKMAQTLWHANHHREDRNREWSPRAQIELREALDTVTDPDDLTWKKSRRRHRIDREK